MTDKKLLELAAKAAGIEVKEWYLHLTDGWIACLNGERPFWSPLINDGDALRLAVQLNININFDYCSDDTPVVLVSSLDHSLGEMQFGNFPYSYAATRRAIVRAAAEIGKRME